MTEINNIEKIKQMIEYPKLYLSNYFGDVKSEIDIEFFKLRSSSKNEINIQKNNKKWLNLIELIDKCQAKCIDNKIPNDLIEETIKKLDNIESKQTVKDLYKIPKRNKNSSEQQDDDEFKLENEIKEIKNKLESFLLANDSYILFRNFGYKNKTMLVEEGFTQLEIEK